MNELDRGFRRALEFDDEHDKRWQRKTAMTELPTWRRCPKCGAVEIYTGKPRFAPDTVFINFIPTRYLTGPNILAEIPTALECPNCGHTVNMQ